MANLHLVCVFGAVYSRCSVLFLSYWISSVCIIITVLLFRNIVFDRNRVTCYSIIQPLLPLIILKFAS